MLLKKEEDAFVGLRFLIFGYKEKEQLLKKCSDCARVSPVTVVVYVTLNDQIRSHRGTQSDGSEHTLI